MRSPLRPRAREPHARYARMRLECSGDGGDARLYFDLEIAILQPAPG